MRDITSVNRYCLREAMEPLLVGVVDRVDDLEFWPRTVVICSLLKSPQVINKRVSPKNQKEYWILRCREKGCTSHCSFLMSAVSIDEESLRARGNTFTSCIAEPLPQAE